MRRGPPRRATLLLTDIEGSARLWQLRPAAMRVALRRHDELVEQGVRDRSGVVLTSHGEGDSFFAAFQRALDGVLAAAEIQVALSRERWPRGARLRVRMAVHTGDVEPDYRGSPANRCARLRACAHGGQVLLSSVTAHAVGRGLPAGLALRDLGEHQLRDLAQPERIYQLVVGGVRSRFPGLRSGVSLAHNLPSQLSSFVGRTREIAEVRRLLAACRLVTLVGVGGCGKTRLALKVASELIARFPGGTWLVDLAPIDRSADLSRIVADMLAWRRGANRDPLATIVDRLAQARTLLVLDNCEHVAEASAALAWTLLTRCPRLRILATSRQAFNIPGELVWQVPPLSTPGPGLPPASELRRFEAVALFVDRAVATRPGFALDPRNASAVAQICRRLDGMPLAIELAAARVRSLSLPDLARRLEDRFLFDQRRPQLGVARHRTLRAAIDWSYNFLDPMEQALFRRLAVFTGGFQADSVEAVCATPPIEPGAILDLLDRLVDRSLVQVTDDGGPLRYRMLETLRQYGLELLSAEGEAHAVRERHVQHFLDLVERAERLTWGPDEAAMHARLSVETDNVRVALTWSRTANPEAFVRLCTVMATIWIARQRLAEGRQWLADALEGWTDRTLLRAAALRRLGAIAFHQHDYDAAEAAWRESLGIAEEQGDLVAVGRTLNNLALVPYNQLRFDEADALYLKALAVFHEVGHESMFPVLLDNLGLLRTEMGRLDEGRALIEEALTLLRTLGNQQLIGAALGSLAINAIYKHEHDVARAACREGLQLSVRVDDRVHVALSLECMALLAADQGDLERSVRLAGAVAAVRSALGAPASLISQRRHERWLRPAREELGKAAAEELWREGFQLSIDEAVEYGLQGAAGSLPA